MFFLPLCNLNCLDVQRIFEMNFDKCRPVIYKYGKIEELVWLFENGFECMSYLAGQDPNVNFDHVNNDEAGKSKIISLKSLFNALTDKNVRTQYMSIPTNSIKEIKSKLTPGSVEIDKNDCSLRVGFYKNEFWFIFQNVSKYLGIRKSFSAQKREVCPIM